MQNDSVLWCLMTSKSDDHRSNQEETAPEQPDAEAQPKQRANISLQNNNCIDMEDAERAAQQHQKAEEGYWQRGVFWQRITAIAAILAFCAAAIYAYFARQQVTAMNMATVQTQKLIDAASSQVNIVQQQLEDSEAVQRAHLVIEDFDIGPTSSPNNSTTNRISFKLRNVGTTVAEEINVRFFEGMPFGSNVAKLSFNAFVSRVQPIQSGWNLAAGDTQLVTGAGIITTPDSWNKQFEAAVAYRDIFGRVWKVADCISYDATAKRFARCPYARHHD